MTTRSAASRVSTGTRHAGTNLTGPNLIRLLGLERAYLNEQDKLELCARVKQARIEAGLEQREIGEMLEPPVEDRTIRNYESTRPPFRYLRQWAEITNVTYDWLLRGDEPETAPASAAVQATVLQRLDRIEAQLTRLLALSDPDAQADQA